MSEKPAAPAPPPASGRVAVRLPGNLEPAYSNFALITHSPSEVVIDFARILPNVPKAKVHARIMMTPMNAKLLLNALRENLEKFEAQYGEIKTPQQGFSDGKPIGFRK